MYRDPVATAAEWRARADTEQLSIRELMIAVTARPTFVGSPATVAMEMDRLVQGDACDGFILIPHITPAGLERFVEHVVPILQERGVFRAEYSGPMLRDHLGLSVPDARAVPKRVAS
jgi:alkanesulfonate monooxygenase SsuD/methylene tetrahydromethanopterin reductase-like flavin-dependent oxidoreductase (luciferase family)